MRLICTLVLMLMCGIAWSQVNAIKSNSATFEVTYSSLKVYPNPLVSQGNLEFTLPQNSQVRVTMLNILGAEVRELIRETRSAGNQNIQFNADQLEKGTYFLRLSVNGEIIKTVRVAVSNRS